MAEMEKEVNRGTREIEFNVSGMSCHGCEQALSMLLRQHDAVESAQADAKSGKVRVSLYRDVDRTELIERIKSAGYDVR
ncbi:MAG: heavy-metal-associated domain-containing protein [Planctomycetes bacterium]|nr:heavy-metal-associated domain-containing protein [Planctomycetota bacterium]